MNQRPRIAYETRLTLMALGAGLPGLLVSCFLLWSGGYSARAQWSVTFVLAVLWLGFTIAIRTRLIRPLRTLSNLLAALQEGDYSIRARASHPADALDEVYQEVNTLSRTLEAQRRGAMEATALLRAVMEEIDVAVFTFDHEQKLRLVNRAGERILARTPAGLLGSSAAELNLAEYLESSGAHTIQHTFPGGAGRWGIRATTFRQDGFPHRLLVIEDLTRTLREEELQAWKRLVRVLGHELNNSLAPIHSIAGSLAALITRTPRPADWEDDAQRGLRVIEGRSEALTRFLESYARLAKLPPPRLDEVDVTAWVWRVARLETRVPVKIEPGPDVVLNADGDQLDQLLINLVRNAAEASQETGSDVRVGWRSTATHFDLWVRDEGPGLANTANLFVPFFTTKPGGSGIGLVLSRQIAEAHGGDLTLQNRQDTRGCEALLRLPAFVD